MTAILPERARKVENRALFGSRKALTPGQIDSIREMVDGDFNGFRTYDGTLMARRPLAQKWSKITDRDSSETSETALGSTWALPNASTEYAILRNIRRAGDLALRYQITRNAADAAAVCRILNAFGSMTSADTTNNDNALHFSEWWPVLIQAAIYVQDSASYTESLDRKFQRATLSLYDALHTAYTFEHQNNWIAWGLSLEFSVAGFTGDRQMHDNAVYRFQQYFREGIKSGWEVRQPNSPALGQLKDNVPIWEVYRTDYDRSFPWSPPPASGQATSGGLAKDRSTSIGNGGRGLLYSNHALNGITMACEWARLNGTWLYDYVTPDGSSVRGLWESVSYMNRWAEGGPQPGGNDPAREDVSWFNVTGSSWDPQSSRGVRGFYWTRCYGYVNILQTLWPNEDAAYFIRSNRYNTNSASTEVDYTLLTPTESAPDPEAREIDYFGMRNTEFLYRRTGLWG